MGIVVQKFGGTSVADTVKIKNIATKISEAVAAGSSVVAVVSAMSGVTNQLVSYCSAIASLHDHFQLSEYDTALASGEMVTSALLALALQEIGVPAKSLLAWQIPIRTDNFYSKALIKDIETSRIMSYVADKVVPVIAGFQGIDQNDRITTLGRGGSDTTAVAVAAAIKADRCDIYTDVDGVYTSDPRLVSDAKKISIMSYEEMLEFASVGAKVLHTRAVQIAMQYGVPLQVLSSFANKPGTLITDSGEIMEDSYVTGITYNKNLAAIHLSLTKDLARTLIDALGAQKVQIEMVYRSSIERYNTTYIVALFDLSVTEKVLSSCGADYAIMTDIGVVSVVGRGLKREVDIFNKVLGMLTTMDTKCEFITGSETKISVLLHESEVEALVKALHYDLQMYFGR
jgi:aspartate kinase